MCRFAKNTSRLIFSMIFLLLYGQLNAQSQVPTRALKTCRDETSSQYAGRFKVNGSSVLIVEENQGEITLRPIFWRSTQPLRRINGDLFAVEERADRQVEFIRDGNGCVAKIKVAGFGDDGVFSRLGKERTPIELLFAGQAVKAAGRMVRAEPQGIENFIKIAANLLQKFPSKSSDAVKFLRALVKYYPQNSTVYAVLGDAYIASGDRRAAQQNYLRAYQLNSKNQAAIRGLRRLKALPSPLLNKQTGWMIPFSLDDLFKPPTPREIKEIEAGWAKRDLAPRNVKEEASGKLDLGFTQATVRIISHSVHGQKHYGAIIVPDGIGKAAPVILDLKGVSWDYFPLNLNDIISPKILGEEQKNFIYFVPAFRGEVINFDAKEYISEGDRTDSWDGATDDALAFLNAALSITSQAAANRICAFGKSRGGSVALLAGIRNPKIKSVLDWAGPVDWFELMGTGGWTQKEIATDALFNKATPKEDGGQFIERFLAKSVEGKNKLLLREVRLKMLASSPLYFARKLPPRLQIHYGIEDEMVPFANGQQLAQAIRSQKRKASMFEAFFYPNAGHDLDQKMAYRQSKIFLRSLLLSDK
ncbi:MAG TPA: hypothetical protein VNB22_02550 [Pyrinomonadaceae bacterium]|nr:hypothetical protein [Pyrinomonadaceae bacterium]